MGNQGQLYFGLFLTSDTLLMAIILLSSFLILAILISMMRIYKKCGKPAISVIIPIWGQIVLFQITGVAWWYIFIPIVNIVMMIKAYILLAKKFGRGAGFAIGMIFLPMIFIPLLSFYDIVSEEKLENLEEPIYNPFNEVNVEPVNILEPVMSAELEKVESVDKPIVMDSEPINELTEPVKEIGEQNNIENSVVEEPVTPVAAEELLDTIDYHNVETVVNNSNINEQIIPEVSNVNTFVNPTVQDIEEALNLNKELSNISYNSEPTNEQIHEEILGEKVENLEGNNKIDEAIELPEFAAKICPACGVSLAENNNFCTSCGTKL